MSMIGQETMVILHEQSVQYMKDVNGLSRPAINHLTLDIARRDEKKMVRL